MSNTLGECYNALDECYHPGGDSLCHWVTKTCLLHRVDFWQFCYTYRLGFSVIPGQAGMVMGGILQPAMENGWVTNNAMVMGWYFFINFLKFKQILLDDMSMGFKF